MLWSRDPAGKAIPGRPRVAAYALWINSTYEWNLDVGQLASSVAGVPLGKMRCPMFIRIAAALSTERDLAARTGSVDKYCKTATSIVHSKSNPIVSGGVRL